MRQAGRNPRRLTARRCARNHRSADGSRWRAHTSPAAWYGRPTDGPLVGSGKGEGKLSDESGHRAIKCSRCGRVAASIHVVPPEQTAASWSHFPLATREVLEERRGDPPQWWFIIKGVERGNGAGDPIDEDSARRYLDAFTAGDYASIERLGLYDTAGFCSTCRVPYCSRHWSMSSGGAGECPRGHFKSLDPHWSPRDYD